MTKAKRALPQRKPRAWQGPRRRWLAVKYPQGVDLTNAEDCALYLIAAKEAGPEQYVIAKQEVDSARMTVGNSAVRSFTCHDTASGERRMYICASV